MADRELAFSTFLKLLELPEPQKAAALRGFKRGGGFRYWRPLQAVAPEVFGGKIDLSEIQERVARMAKGHQRKYNEHALINLLRWASRRKLTPGSHPGKIVKQLGKSELWVRLEPEVAFAMDKHDYLMHVWSTNNPVLSEETLSMGLYFFRDGFRNHGHENYQFLIFDTVKDRIFAEFGIVERAAEMLADQEATLHQLWSSVDRGADVLRPRGRPGDRPAPQPRE